MTAGHIRFDTLDPVESAHYAEAVDLMLEHGWIKRPDLGAPEFYEPASKGLGKG